MADAGKFWRRVLRTPPFLSSWKGECHKYGKVPFFENDEENHSESNESRNIDFDLLSYYEFCAILSRNDYQDDPEQVV